VLAIVADAKQFVTAMLKNLPHPTMTERSGVARAVEANSGLAELNEYECTALSVVETIRDTLPMARIIGDSTQLSYAAHSAMAAEFPCQFWCSSTGFGTLGYALPAAIGASLIDKLAVVAIIGDGGLQFTLSELSSAKEAGARIILIVHDNQGYGEIKKFMQFNNIEAIGVDPLTPDLCAIARACGWQVLASNALALPSDLRKAAESDQLCMIYLAEEDIRA
jgi:acetolactate synthase-1/2/3 large subunit